MTRSQLIEQGLQRMKDWCTLHRSIEIIYVVDGYEIWFMALDGQRIDSQYRGATLPDAIIEIGKTEPPKSGVGR